MVSVASGRVRERRRPLRVFLTGEQTVEGHIEASGLLAIHAAAAQYRRSADIKDLTAGRSG